MVKMIIIEGDANDGDYIERSNIIEQKDLDIILPLFERIKKNNGIWESYDGGKDPYKMYNVTDEERDIFCGLTPKGEYGISCITSIKILEVFSIETIW